MRHSMLAVAGFVVLGSAVVVTTTTYADNQGTQGMQRRDDRRDNRQGARAQKQACKAGDEKSRAECRHDKRNTKQEGRPVNQ